MKMQLRAIILPVVNINTKNVHAASNKKRGACGSPSLHIERNCRLCYEENHHVEENPTFDGSTLGIAAEVWLLGHFSSDMKAKIAAYYKTACKSM